MSGNGSAFGIDPDDESDPYSTPWFRRLTESVRSELVPKLHSSRAVISLVMDGDPDVKFALELGFSVMLDKPIIAVVSPGRQIPVKLAAVVDFWIENHPDPAVLACRIDDAMKELGQLGE